MGVPAIPPHLPPEQSARLGIRAALGPHEAGVEQDVELYGTDTGKAVPSKVEKSNALPAIARERWREKFTSDDDLTVIPAAESDPVVAHRFALISAFRKAHHRSPDETEMSAICQAAFAKAGVTPPKPAPLPPGDLL